MKRAFAVVVWIAVVLNVLKGIPTVVHDLGFPYWVLNYRDGFIRRGLVGTLFGPFVDGHDWGTQREAILGIHCAIAFLSWGAMAYVALSLARATQNARVRTALRVGTAAFFLSACPVTMTQLAGYLDIILLAIAIGATWLADRGRIRTAAVMAAFGPLVHDAFVFLWAPALLLALRHVVRIPRDGRRAAALRFAPLVAPLVTAVLAQLLASKAASQKQIDALPVTDWMKQTFHTQQFGMSMMNGLTVMKEKFLAMPEQALLVALLLLPAAVVIAASAASIERSESRAKRIAFTVAVTLSPCAVLLVAWDLSRFVVWATYGAFVLLVANAGGGAFGTVLRDDAPSARRPHALGIGLGVSLAFLVLLSTGPYVYAYFEFAHVGYSFQPEIMRHTPGAAITNAWTRVYNRRQPRGTFSLKSNCRPTSHRAERVGDCVFELQKTGWVESHDVFVDRPGEWLISADVTPIEKPDCPKATQASVSPWTFYRFMPRGKPVVVDIGEGKPLETRLFFDDDAAANARTRIGIQAIDGCLRVDDIRMTRVADAPTAK